MANFNFNEVILGGRLTADPELKTTQSGLAVTTFTIAINRRGAKDGAEQKADFIVCTAWRQTAELITKFFRKGSCICVTGALQSRSWNDKDGQKRFATEVLVDSVHFVDSKAESSAQDAFNAHQTYTSVYEGVATRPNVGTPPVPSQTATQPQFETLGNDEELPF